MRFNFSFRSTLFICAIFSIVSLNAQNKSVITHVEVDNKKNGAFLKIHTTSPINTKYVSGWTAEGGWFYITILGAISDSIRVKDSQINDPILELQVENTDESTQLAFKVAKQIDTFEFYDSKSPPELLVSLRFPIDQVAEVLEMEKEEMDSSKTVTAYNEETKPYNGVLLPDNYKRLRTALYMTGTSLTIAGAAIEAGESRGFGWEIPTGLVIIAGTFVYDKYLRKAAKE